MSDTQTTNVTPDSSTTRNRRSDKKSSKTGKIAAAVIVVLLLAVYGGGVYYYSSHFPHNTLIRVVFPTPLFPTTPIFSFGKTRNEALLNIFFLSNVKDKFSTVNSILPSPFFNFLFLFHQN